MIQITGGKYLIEPAQQAVSFTPFFAQAKEGSARRTPPGFHASHQFLAHRARPSRSPLAHLHSPENHEKDKAFYAVLA